MTISLVHAFASSKGDGADATLVQPSNWNAQHTLNCATGVVLGRTSAGTGAVQELTITTSGAALIAAADSNAAALAVGAIPIGGGIHWFDDVLPVGTNGVVWGWANGQAISRSTFSVLFTRWATNYGVGDGTTTFNVPDVRERVLVHKSTMGASSSQNIITQYTMTTLSQAASPIGEAKHTLLTVEMPQHTHGVTDPGHTHNLQGATAQGFSNPTVVEGNGLAGTLTGGAGSSTTGITIQNNGNNTPHNIVQPSYVCNFILRLS